MPSPVYWERYKQAYIQVANRIKDVPTCLGGNRDVRNIDFKPL